MNPIPLALILLAGALPAWAAGQKVVSIYDLPAGSFDGNSKALRDYVRRERTGQPHPAPGPREEADRFLAGLRDKQAQISDVADARLLIPSFVTVLSDDAAKRSLLLKPMNLPITADCSVLGTYGHGGEHKGRDTGYGRLYRCADGDVAVGAMAMVTMEAVVFKESANVDIGGIPGTFLRARDAKGNSHSTLNWVANDISFSAQKSGTGPETKAWLLRYAEQARLAGQERY